ncbi:MAG: AarF/UbiB family protein [Lachnospiraceae bacterium]|nr:AarF/UbiB family protein [Lachnospiraceae bacterium]
MGIPDQLTIHKILAAPRHSLIYLASDKDTSYVVKTPRQKSDAILEAYEDEYHTLSSLSHPVLPVYYGLIPELIIGQAKDPVPALLMEYIDGTALSSAHYLTTKQLKKYILDLGDVLLLLLSNGLLYTDLHPGNLLIAKDQLRLIDFTCAYYFIRNPHPSYVPKISYHLNQNLKGQQLLIQALTFLLSHLSDDLTSGIPPSLLSLGENPYKGLDFSDFLNQLSIKWRTD